MVLAILFSAAPKKGRGHAGRFDGQQSRVPKKYGAPPYIGSLKGDATTAFFLTQRDATSFLSDSSSYLKVNN